MQIKKGAGGRSVRDGHGDILEKNSNFFFFCNHYILKLQ